MNKNIRISLAVAVLLVTGAFGLTGQNTATSRAAALAPIPAGFPNYFGYGLFNSSMSDMHPGVTYDYRYQYLSGGVNTGDGWQTWGNNYAGNYVAQSRQRGYMPGFIYYMILQSAPGYDEYANLNNSNTMRDYYNDFKTLMQQMNDGRPAFVNIEPDLDGVMQQHASNTGDNAALQPTKVGGSGMAELSGMADNFRNYWQALARLRDLYAPNVVLGQDLSIWGPDYDLTIALRNDPNYNWQAHADRLAIYHNSFGPGYGLNFFSPLDRDAAYYQVVQGSNRWWNEGSQQPNFNTMAAWLGRVNSTTNKRTLMWQVPNGNRQYRTENNTNGHWQDNRPEYFLNATSGRTNMSLWANNGVMGIMFGAGVGSQSHYFDSNGDGITNPAPINGNNLVSSVADDDGGYIRLNVDAYYDAGVLPLPGSTGGTPVPTVTPIRPTATSVVTRTPTRTLTRTPALTPTSTSTSTSTSTPTRTRIPTFTPVSSATPTRTATSTSTPTFTPTPTRTSTSVVVRTPAPNVGTPSPTRVSVTSPVYVDALQNGWKNWSWRSTINLASTDYVHGGSRSLSVKYNSAWAGLQLGHNGFNTTRYNRVTFWVNGGASSGQQVDIVAADANGNYLVSQPLDNYISGRGIARNTWRLVTVPLADLGATNRVITAIVLQDRLGNAQPTYYLDDIQFAGGN